ncbi:MAG: acyl-CoA dehydrogenase family protein [Bacteroidota bacterium]
MSAPSTNSTRQGGDFLITATAAQDIFTADEFSEEQKSIRQMILDFCEAEIQKPFFERGRELYVTNPDEKEIVLQTLKKAGELGLCSVAVPEEYGGMDLDFVTNSLFAETTAAGYSFATTLGAHTSIGSLPIVYYGTDEQKQKYLPKIATAEYVAAYALTEPNAGSDANSGQTSATLSEDGKHYLLTGQKIWITNGGFADVYVVFAKIDEDENLSAFIVERDYEGFTVGKEEHKMGIKSSSTVQIYFDNCKVPMENLLGERGGGFKMALNILNTGRVKAGAGGMGGAKFAMASAIEYANQRKQFGQPISDYGAIKHKIGSVVTETFALEAASYRIAHVLDEYCQAKKDGGMSPGEAKRESTREFAIEASLLKVRGAELVCRAADEGIQIYGGMGYAIETGMEMAYRDSRILKIYEGTNEINRMLAVGELGKRALQTKELNLKSAGKTIPGFIRKSFLSGTPAPGGAWEEHSVQALKNTFLYLFSSSGKALGKKLVEEQEIVLLLADVLSDAFMAESVWLRFQKMKGNADANRLKVAEAATQLFIYEAVENTRRRAIEVIDSYTGGVGEKFVRRAINKMLKRGLLNPKDLRRVVANAAIKEEGYPL